MDSFVSSMAKSFFRNKKLEELKIELPQYRKINDAGVFLNGQENVELLLILID